MSNEVRDSVLFRENEQRNSINVKQCYIDWAWDILAWLMFSQIMYWNLPTKKWDKTTKLRVKKEWELRLAKKDNERYEEIRMTVAQAKRARWILVKRWLIQCETMKFAWVPTTHIKINWDKVALYMDSSYIANPLGIYSESYTENTTETTTYSNINKKGTYFLEEKKDDISNFDFNDTYTSLDNKIVNEQEVEIISKDIIDENDKRKNKQKESGGGRKNYDKMNNDLMDKLMFNFWFNYDDVKKSMSWYFPNPKDIRNACVDIYNFSNEVQKEYWIDLDIEYTYDIINLFRYHFSLDKRKDMLQYIEYHWDEINNIDDLLRETERFNIM